MGERLPDAPVKGVAGAATLLLAAMQRWEHHLLLFPWSHDAKVVEELVGIADEVLQAYPGLFTSHLFVPAGGGTTPATSPGVKFWLDADGKLHEKFAAEYPTVIVVRPDGYIGYRCQPANKEKMLGWLGKYLIT